MPMSVVLLIAFLCGLVLGARLWHAVIRWALAQ